VTTGTSDDSRIPSLADFLAAPEEEVAAVMPPTVIVSLGGTRRSAALRGIGSDSDEYARFSRARMIACFDLFFRLGVRHLFNSVVRPRQFEEVGRYRDRLISWIEWGLTGPEALADYARLGWRVRLGGGEAVPQLRELNDRLVAATPSTWNHTLWLYAAPTRGSLWDQALAVAHATGARTHEELIRALLGEDVPTAGMWIGTGKPVISEDQIPMAMVGETNLYWTARPGYDIDEEMIRRIVYDCVYRRRTWQKDKSARYADIDKMRSLLETRHVMGIGKRVRAFWYPDHDQD
jgi:hypothetical protein